MGFTRWSACRFTPATCSCEIEYGQYRDGVIYTTAYRTAETIITTCDEHSEITDPVELDGLIAGLNVPFSRACGAIANGIGQLVSWSADYETGIITMTVQGADAALQAILDAMPELELTYT